MSIADVGCDLDPAGVSENVRKFGDASSQVFAAKCSWRVGRGGRAWQSEAVTTTWNTTVLVEKWEFFEHFCKYWWRTYLSVQKTDVVQNMSKPCWLPTNKLRLLSFPSCRGSFRSSKDLFWARVVKHAIAKHRMGAWRYGIQSLDGLDVFWFEHGPCRFSFTRVASMVVLMDPMLRRGMWVPEKRSCAKCIKMHQKR